MAIIKDFKKSHTRRTYKAQRRKPLIRPWGARVSRLQSEGQNQPATCVSTAYSRKGMFKWLGEKHKKKSNILWHKKVT